MNNNIDAKELLARTDISTVVGRYVALKKRGAELAGICPFHNDTKPSLWVNDKKGIFKCFVCGEGGDAIHFVMKHEGVTFQDALTIIDGGNTAGGTPDKKHIDKARRPEWRPILPVPDSAPKPPRDHYRYGAPSMGWRYNGTGGELLGYVLRFNLPDGGKDVLPLTYCTDGKRTEWRWHGWPKPRPLYGLERLAQRPTAPVLIVEGEKAADAAKVLLPQFAAITWPGGSRAIQYIDWRPLAGRKVLIWPDADRAGISAAYHIAATLQGVAEAVRMVKPDASWPKGFDAADATWAPEQAKDELMGRVGNVDTGRPIYQAPEWLREKWPSASVFYEFPPEPDGRVFYTLLEHTEGGIIAREVVSPKPKAEKPAEAEEPPAYKADHPGYVPPINDLDAMPYRPLGYNKSESGQNEFYVYASKPNQVLRMSPGSFSKTGLMQLADLNWWESHFPGRNGLSVEAAAQSVINACYDLGVYDLDNVRGVGAWIDEGRPVLHAGSHLVVDGRPINFVNIKSRFIYEAGKDFGLRMHKPLEPREAVKALELAKMLRWERPINAYLFIGWAVLAPVCGALYWRPHIWLTGGAGSGKTTAIDILKQLIGKMAVHLQAMTTEAGIRQSLASSARPVLFDELDIDNAEQDIARVRSILSLVRASSSAGGDVGKGGQGGTAKMYKIRSCFAFASINPQLTAGADKSRVTVLSLLSPPRGQSSEELRDGWGKISSFMLELLTEEYVERFLSRTVSLLPTILKNAKVFAQAAAVVLDEQRAGDQLGTIIAGAYSLHSNKVVSYNEAAAWLKDRDWVDIRNNERDEVMLFNHIMQQIITAETGAGTRAERQIGELIRISINGVTDGEIVTSGTAAGALRRNGVRVEPMEGVFYVSSSSHAIKRMLAKTRWSEDHEKALARLDGAYVHQRARFGDGITTRAVSLPITMLDM